MHGMRGSGERYENVSEQGTWSILDGAVETIGCRDDAMVGGVGSGGPHRPKRRVRTAYDVSMYMF